jgi:ABC-type Fe3+/spermidine/putrescine transport system ATPase subunit
MTGVVAKDISKVYGTTKALDHVNLEARNAEFVTLLGPSGCGKSTTLRVLAGLIKADEGKVYFDDRDVTDLSPNRRNIGFVFQRVALFPHMSVRKNIAFGLKARHVSDSEVKKKIKEVLAIVHMEGFENRSPSQLSGGQAQRIEIARVLATDPEVLLFDEPLSNIDAKLRDELKFEIRKIQRATGKTMVYVTHDQGEAFAMSDRVYLMSQGVIEQVGTPTQLYLDPSTPFVAGFIGQNNFIEGRIERIDPSSRSGLIRAGSIEIQTILPDGYSVEDKVTACLRPEDIEILPEGKVGNEADAKGRVAECVFMGNTTRVMVDVNGVILKVDLRGPERFSYLNAKDQEVGLIIRKSTVIKGPGSS